MSCLAFNLVPRCNRQIKSLYIQISSQIEYKVLLHGIISFHSTGGHYQRSVWHHRIQVTYKKNNRFLYSHRNREHASVNLSCVHSDRSCNIGINQSVGFVAVWRHGMETLSVLRAFSEGETYRQMVPLTLVQQYWFVLYFCCAECKVVSYMSSAQNYNVLDLDWMTSGMRNSIHAKVDKIAKLSWSQITANMHMNGCIAVREPFYWAQSIRRDKRPLSKSPFQLTLPYTVFTKSKNGNGLFGNFFIWLF